MTGLEPATSGVTGRCSNQLSYIPSLSQVIRERLFLPRGSREVKGCEGLSFRNRAVSLSPSLKDVFPILKANGV